MQNVGVLEASYNNSHFNNSKKTTLLMCINFQLQASLPIDESITINLKKKNDMTISENYAFTGVHHIFDQVIFLY